MSRGTAGVHHEGEKNYDNALKKTEQAINDLRSLDKSMVGVYDRAGVKLTQEYNDIYFDSEIGFTATCNLIFLVKEKKKLPSVINSNILSKLISGLIKRLTMMYLYSQDLGKLNENIGRLILFYESFRAVITKDSDEDSDDEICCPLRMEPRILENLSVGIKDIKEDRADLYKSSNSIKPKPQPLDIPLFPMPPNPPASAVDQPKERELRSASRPKTPQKSSRHHHK